ncbi:MAG TPA: rod shape-determining protein MreC [Patescibacteria group bacterium]|nr:rod shape-determining protein MreC [Patescibacteria group bacterium]
MKSRENIGIVFFVFLLFSILIFFLSKTGFLDKPSSILYSAVSVVSKSSYNLLSSVPFFGDAKIKKLEEQNLLLSKKIVDEQKLIAENKSLHDQFQQTFPKSLDLLPSRVVGAPRFLPGISSPETYVIDKGAKDGVRVGNAIVVGDNLLGIVNRTAESLSEVLLITNPSSKFAAKTTSGVLGIVKGQGNGDIFLDNVLLSDSLEKGNFVVTVGSLNLDSTGFPQGLIVGKITSVDKNPSDLFQKAKVESLVNFSKISEVFVVVGTK